MNYIKAVKTIELDTGIDLSGMETINILWWDPARGKGSFAATYKGSDTSVATYTTTITDIEIAGNWRFQVEYTDYDLDVDYTDEVVISFRKNLAEDAIT